MKAPCHVARHQSLIIRTPPDLKAQVLTVSLIRDTDMKSKTGVKRRQHWSEQWAPGLYDREAGRSSCKLFEKRVRVNSVFCGVLLDLGGGLGL